MAIKKLSKKPSPLLTVLDGYLSQDQRRTFEQSFARPAFLLPVPNFTRMLAPEGEENFLDRIPDRVVEALRRGESDLIIDSAFEILFYPPFTAEVSVPALYAALAARGIPPERLVVVSCNLQSGVAHERVADQLGIKRRLRIWASDFVLAGAALSLTPSLDRQADPPSDRLQDEPLRHFLFLNRKVKGERVRMLMFLARQVGLQKAFVSLLGDGRSRDHSALMGSLARIVASEPEGPQREACQRAADEILAAFPMTLQESRPAEAGPDYGWRALDQVYYDRSFVSLVSETMFTRDDSLVITEKTMKPVCLGHPFLVMGDPGTLARLRVLGFQTCHAVFDESYDDIRDRKARLAALQKEVDRIGAMSQAELLAARRALDPVIDHNRRYAKAGFSDLMALKILDEWSAIVAA